MCGKGVHVVIREADGSQYCLMDYFCGADFCDCVHPNGCDCPYEEDEDD